MNVEASTSMMMISGECVVNATTPMEKLVLADAELVCVSGVAHMERIDMPAPAIPTWPLVHDWQTCANYEG